MVLGAAGLLYEAIPSAQLPLVADMSARASLIAAGMHNPRTGILSRYPHLMLSDVLDVYASGHIALGKTLVRADKWEEAKKEFTEAASLDGDTSIIEAYELLGLTQLYMKDCDGALRSFQEAKTRSFAPSAAHIRLESLTYRECVGDEKRAAVLFLNMSASGSFRTIIRITVSSAYCTYDKTQTRLTGR